MRRMMPIALAFLSATAGCIETPTSVELSFERTAEALEVRALSISIWDGSGQSQPATRLPEHGELPPTNGNRLGTLVVYGSPGEDTLRIDVRGLDAAGTAVAEGVVVVALHAGRQVHSRIVLAPGRLSDGDGDGVPDELDNCPGVANPAQEDWNDNLRGDACDALLPPRDAVASDGAGGRTTKPVTAGEALAFDGSNDYLPIPRRVWGDFTVEMWIKSTCGGIGKSTRDGIGLLVNTAPRASQTFSLSVLNGKLAFAAGADGTSVVSTSNVDSGQWVHVAATRSALTGTLRVMVDGVEEAQVDGTTRPLVDAPTMYLGGKVGESRMFCGTVDELRVWNVVRQAADITRDRGRILTGNEPGLVSYYRFDESPGAVVTTDDAPSGGSSVLGGGSVGQQPAWMISDAPLAP